MLCRSADATNQCRNIVRPFVDAQTHLSDYGQSMQTGNKHGLIFNQHYINEDLVQV